MRKLVLFALVALVAAACGSESGADTTTTAQAPTTTIQNVTTTVSDATTTTEDVSGSESAQFAVTNVNFGASPFIVITNIGDETASLAGHFLCQRPTYAGLPDIEVEAGQAIGFSLGGGDFTPPDGVIVSDEVLDLGELSNSSGEMGLYTSSNFSSTDDIISYVEWGRGDHGRSETAIAAGIWQGFVPTTESTGAIEAQSLPALSADDWTEG